MDVNLEVSVNYEFSQMLKALEAKGLFGKDEPACRNALNAIAVEVGKRQFVFGMSVGASTEAVKNVSQ